jgi:hypothetical protein
VEWLAGPPATLRCPLELLAPLKPLVEGAREQLSRDEQPVSLVAEATIASLAILPRKACRWRGSAVL